MAGIVAIGASSGGVDALQTIASGLPEGFAAPIVVVLHVGASHSLLPLLLSKAGAIRATHPSDGEALLSGHIFVAPPDRHMLVEDGRIRLSRGPRENWARPAIDPLFRSVAQGYGPDAIGVVLTGGLNDGTAGLFEIKRLGGTAIVQDPAEAAAPSMPQSALGHVATDYCVPVAAIAPLLVRLIPRSERRTRPSGVHVMTDGHFTKPTAQTCPECGGAMHEEQLGTLTRFRCHIGHIMTAEVLAAANLATLESDLSVCVRAAHERAELCREIARKHEALGDAPSAARWRMAADEAEVRTRSLAEVAEQPWYRPEDAHVPAETVAGVAGRA